MAIESVAVTEGTGKNVAVDTVDTDKQVQYVKLMDGTDGQATVIAGGAAGLKVDLTSTGANSNKILTTPDLPSGAATSAKQLPDGHSVALSATDNAVLDDIASKVGNIPSKGQALAAASTPVVLTAAQESALTPPAAITGFATSAKQDTGNTSVGNLDTKMGEVQATPTSNTLLGRLKDLLTGVVLAAGTNLIGKVSIDQATANANEVVVKSITAGDNNIGNVDIASIAAGANHVGKVIPSDYELAGNTLHVSKYYTSAGAATDGIIWSPAAGKRWYVTDLIVQVSADATVTFEDDLTGGDSPVMKMEMKANQGWCKTFKTPLFSGEDAADLIVTTTAGNIYITATGYEV